MRVEVKDPHSGAILFKKDRESKDLEQALKKIEYLEDKVKKLEDKLNYVMSKVLV